MDLGLLSVNWCEDGLCLGNITYMDVSRGIQYVLNTMHKCIMVKAGGSLKNKKNKNRERFINFC